MDDGVINFELIRSDRTTCQIQVTREGQVIVRAPLRMPERDIMRFVSEKSEWIERAQAKVTAAKERAADATPLSDADIDALADKALEYIPQRVALFSTIVGVDYGRITIRNQKTRWGSCSGKKNLNFNCLLMLTPSEVVDYVVVHELAHIRQRNHSPKFWQEVEKYMPDWKPKRKWLKEHGILMEIF